MNSTVEDPVHTYCHSEKYDVTLTVANELGNNTVIKYDYINVGTHRQSQDTDEECSTETKEVCENTKPICEETKPVCKENNQADDNGESNTAQSTNSSQNAA
jgi:PKD repeat protein